MPDGGPGPDSRLLGSLGLARRAGRIAVGTRAVLEAARSGELALVVMAADASANASDRIRAARRRAGVETIRCADKEALGDALGRPPVAVVGVTDEGLARAVEREAEAAPGNDERPGGKYEAMAATNRPESEST